MNLFQSTMTILAFTLVSSFVQSAELVLEPEQLKTTNLTTINVTAQEHASRLELTGTLAVDQRKSYRVAPVVEGIVTELRVVSHDRIQKGLVLARLRSDTLGQAQADFLEASAQFQLIQAEQDRVEGLSREGIVARSRLLKVNSEYKTARANLEQRRRLLILTGLSEQQINALEDKRNLVADFELTSPIDGIVSASKIESGQQLSAGETAFHVDDLSSLWLEVQIPVASLPLVTIGAEAIIYVRSRPEQPFRGTLQSLGTEVSRQSQTLSGRIVVTNTEELLYPGMHAEVTLSGITNRGLVVPTSAVFRIGDQAFVFRALGEGHFKPARVRTGTPADTQIPILSGLELGDTIVISGVAELKSHWQYQGGE
tara:strand:- start:3652 stop:4761 length:1110 start_codon:yes stop_codon:yes gene_type:complete